MTGPQAPKPSTHDLNPSGVVNVDETRSHHSPISVPKMRVIQTAERAKTNQRIQLSGRLEGPSGASFNAGSADVGVT